MNEDLWREVLVSSVTRAIVDTSDCPLENDDVAQLGLRKIDPLPTRYSETAFLEAASLEMWKAWQIGASPLVQTPSIISNHLTDAVHKYFSESGREVEAVRFFDAMFDRDVNMAALLAKSLINTNEEIQAIQIIYDATKRADIPFELLVVQSKFMASKEQYEKALYLAKFAVTRSPTEFEPWAHLALMYIEVQDYDSALLALNSCPMFSYHEKDAHRMPPPARVHLPLRNDVSAVTGDLKAVPQHSGTVFDNNDPNETIVHPEMQRLPSLSLRGTFNAAYNILVKINARIGWDELLKRRSTVFVMEDEYRIHKGILDESLAEGHDEQDIGISENQINSMRLDDEEEVIPVISTRKSTFDQILRAQPANPLQVSKKGVKAPPVDII